MATQALTLEGAKQRAAALENEIADLKARLAAEQENLARLDGQRTSLSEKIASGAIPASKVSEIARLIEQAEAKRAGFASVLARKQTELDALMPELRRIGAETLTAARRAEMEKLRTRGTELVASLNKKLAELVTKDLPELDAIRDQLAELRDVGGFEARANLGYALIHPNGQTLVEYELVRTDRWLTNPVPWKLRGDVVLTVRNLWPPKR